MRSTLRVHPPARLLGTAFLLVPLAAPGAVPAPSPSPVLGAGAAGKVFLTLEEALELAFPDCDVERETFYLSDGERERAGELAGRDVERAVVHAWTGRAEGALVGTAYVDAHVVRSLKETLMVVVGPDGSIRRLEMLAFGEPLEYVPRGAWYEQFLGRPLDDELRLDRGIRRVTGATLTAEATTQAARRVLAIHAVLQERSS